GQRSAAKVAREQNAAANRVERPEKKDERNVFRHLVAEGGDGRLPAGGLIPGKPGGGRHGEGGGDDRLVAVAVPEVSGGQRQHRDGQQQQEERGDAQRRQIEGSRGGRCNTGQRQ